MSKQIDFRPIILAGGSGTRFWPRSRRARAKQVLALDGERSMLQQTVERLKPLPTLDKTWMITNEFLAREIADQLPGVPVSQIVQEPVARNTAPACGLAAFLIERENPDAVLGVFPSDHVIADEPRFLKALQKGIALAAAGENMVVLGIEPTRAETGYGYIETGDLTKDDTRCTCGDSPRSPTRTAPKNLWRRAITTGTRGCSCGRRARWPTPCANTCRRRRHCWRRSPPRRARRSSTRCFARSIRSAKTSAWITRCWSRARPRASTFASLLPAGRVQLERPGIVGLALRVPA